MPSLDGVDWTAGEQHFVTQTSPRVTLRHYAAMTVDLPWSGHQPISYQKLREYAKNNLWLKKRAEFTRERNPGFMADLEVMYGLIMDTITGKADQISARDLTGLVSEAIEVQEMLMEMNPPELAENNEERVSRDDILDMISRHEPLSDDDLLAAALIALEDNVDISDNGDNGDNGQVES